MALQIDFLFNVLIGVRTHQTDIQIVTCETLILSCAALLEAEGGRVLSIQFLAYGDAVICKVSTGSWILLFDFFLYILKWSLSKGKGLVSDHALPLCFLFEFVKRFGDRGVDWVVYVDVCAWSRDLSLFLYGSGLPGAGLKRSERNLEFVLLEKFFFKVINGQFVEVESGSRHVLLLFGNETGVTNSGRHEGLTIRSLVFGGLSLNTSMLKIR